MNHISPSASIGASVVLGDGNTIGPGAILDGPVHVGDRNYIAGGVRVGGSSRERLRPDHRLADPIASDEAWIRIGSDCTIFENAVLHKPMLYDTSIGDRVEIGGFVMVAHDCVIRSDAILSPHTALGAYVTVGVGANLGLGTRVHNRLAIGAYAMCGLASAVVGHVPPVALVYGNPARIRGVNHVGLSRAGFGEDDIQAAAAAIADESGAGFPPELGPYLAAFEEDKARWPTTKGLVTWSP